MSSIKILFYHTIILQEYCVQCVIQTFSIVIGFVKEAEIHLFIYDSWKREDW